MSHEYTILVGGVVIRGGPAPVATAIAWAEDTILAVGSDEEVRAISRGDSRFVDLRAAVVVPLGEPLEVGSRADLAVVDRDPSLAGPATRTLAVVRGGRVVEGALPGA